MPPPGTVISRLYKGAHLEVLVLPDGFSYAGTRYATLSAVAKGTLTADAAMACVDTLRSLEALAHHAWRAAAHLAGRGDQAVHS